MFDGGNRSGFIGLDREDSSTYWCHGGNRPLDFSIGQVT